MGSRRGLAGALRGGEGGRGAGARTRIGRGETEWLSVSATAQRESSTGPVVYGGPGRASDLYLIVSIRVELSRVT